MRWNIVSDRPIYLQLVEQLKLAIVSGVYPPGSRMPTVRELAADASVNANTMQRALAELENSGLVITQRTSGRCVTEDGDIIKQTKQSIAREVIEEFMSKMKSLGISGAQTLELVGYAVADAAEKHETNDQ